MAKIHFGGGVIKTVPLSTANTRGLMAEESSEAIDPQDLIKVIEVSFTIAEAVKILIASIKRLFPKRSK